MLSFYFYLVLLTIDPSKTQHLHATADHALRSGPALHDHLFAKQTP